MVQLVAKKYAVALFELSKEENSVTQLQGEAKIVLDTLGREILFNETLLNPRLTTEQKVEIVNNVFKGFSVTMLNFMDLVLKKSRGAELVDILTEFLELVEEHNGILKAEIVAASKVSDMQLDKIKEKLLKNTTYKDVKFIVKEDSSLIGGMSITAGAYVFDRTVKKQFSDLKSSLLS